jgi:SGNH domain (fused to AT3 domains)
LHWRGYAIWRSSCAYAQTGRSLPAPYFAQCVAFKRDVPRWLARHPEIATVFVAGLTRDVGDDPVASYLKAWKQLPKSVTRLIVVRDTPEMLATTMACVRAHAGSCAVPRAQALHPDPAVAAAQERGLPVIDLTRYFCDARSCFPVIGGVLVHQDMTHVSAAFARTLGPYLLAEVRRIAG